MLTADLDLIRELLDPTTTTTEARRLAPGPTFDPDDRPDDRPQGVTRPKWPLAIRPLRPEVP
jgi:hypothetical protein